MNFLLLLAFFDRRRNQRERCTDLNFGQTIINVKSMVQFITHSAAKEQLIVQHCLEQFRSEFRIILKEQKLSELVDTISELQKSDICINSENLSCISSTHATEERQKITCYNCLKSGNVAPDCRQRKNKCTKCNKWGHHQNYCRGQAKNAYGTTLLADQVALEKATSAQS